MSAITWMGAARSIFAVFRNSNMLIMKARTELATILPPLTRRGARCARSDRSAFTARLGILLRMATPNG